MKKTGLLLILSGCLYYWAGAQISFEDSLKRELSRATTLPDRMRWMHQLSVFFSGSNDSLAEQLGAQIIAMADSSRDRISMVKAYLYNADRCFTTIQLQQFLLKGIQFSQQALKIALDNHLDEYAAWSYLSLARGCRNNGESDKALNYDNLAASVASGIESDSLKTLLYNSLGDTYMIKNEKLLAFRQYLLALNIAEQTQNYALLRYCYTNMSYFYRSLENYEKAKDFEFRKEALQRSKHRLYDLANTYRYIGALYSSSKQPDLGIKYYEKAFAIADSFQYNKMKVMCYLGIINLYIENGQHRQAVDYLMSHKEVRDFFTNAGMTYYIDEGFGAMYTLAGNVDSAGYYLKRCEADYESKTSKWSRFWFYSIYAKYYRLKKDYDSAALYWKKARGIGEEMADLLMMKEAALNLDTLHQLKGDFKNAYVYNALYHQYKDSLNSLAKEKDMLSLEIDNENRRKEREARQMEEVTRRNHNLQYMAITVAIAFIFILLGMAGVFRVSKTTISILGFFAFIFLFEFIILIADNKIHHLTHGEPWKVLAIKIGLIAILLPLHHKLEERVIHYLTTKELLSLKGRGFIRKWLKKKDADVPMGNV